MDKMKKIIETAIRKWLDKYNYLFSSQEIEDLTQMIVDEMDWVSVDQLEVHREIDGFFEKYEGDKEGEL